MRELRTEIEINASAKEVWRFLVDVGQFREWNPFIREVRGEIREGAVLRVRIEPPGGKGMTFKPTVARVIPGHEYRWLDDKEADR